MARKRGVTVQAWERIWAASARVAACHRRLARAATRRWASPTISTEFARQRRDRTIQFHGNRHRVDGPLQLRVDHGSFFKTQLCVDVSRATFSPKADALGF